METVTVITPRVRAMPSWAPQMFVTAMVTAALAGGLGVVGFLSTSGYAAHATIAGNQAEIVALQEKQRDTDARLANLGGEYLSLNAFLEFKSRYDKDQAQTHDFQVRIDTKIDTLLSEHTGTPQK